MRLFNSPLRGALVALGTISVLLVGCSSGSEAPSLAGETPSSDGEAPSPDQTPVRLAINPAQLHYLPIMLAVDEGLFEEAGVRVEIVQYQGSSNGQIPLLARGDIDLAPAVAGPSLFNQYAQGFRIKLIASMTEPQQGFVDGISFLVRTDLWESGAIADLGDLAGKRVEATAEGNPIDYFVRKALEKAGLTRDDVNVTNEARRPSDSVEFLRSGVVDAIALSEPSATLAETQGVGVRWLGYQDIIPDLQETLLAGSEEFLADRPEAAQAVLDGYLRAVARINEAQGSWTPELLDVAVEWTGQEREVLEAMGGVLYWSPTGAIDVQLLHDVQQFWVDEGLVEEPTAVENLIDTSIVEEVDSAEALVDPR